MPPPLLLLQDISLTFGATPLLAGARLAVAAGDRVCLVGRNGSGKSTLLRIAAGLVQPDAGEPLRPARRDDPLSAAGAGSRRLRHDAGLCRGRVRRPDAARPPPRAVSAQGARPVRRGGPRRRCPAARRAAPRWPARWRRSPDILLLDEPTNHLDLPGIEWLERELAGMRSGIVLISHDRRLLERLSRTTVWLDRGVTRTLDEGFAAFEAWRDTILEQEESEHHKLGRKIAMEEDWLRYGVTARRTRNQRRLARTARAAPQAAGAARRAQGTVRLDAAQAELSGRLVAAARGGRQILWRPPDRARFLDPHHARRPGRHRRPERRRQDDAAQPADRRAGAGRGRGAARHQPRAR